MASDSSDSDEETSLSDIVESTFLETSRSLLSEAINGGISSSLSSSPESGLDSGPREYVTKNKG